MANDPDIETKFQTVIADIIKLNEQRCFSCNPSDDMAKDAFSNLLAQYSSKGFSFMELIIIASALEKLAGFVGEALTKAERATPPTRSSRRKQELFEQAFSMELIRVQAKLDPYRAALQRQSAFADGAWAKFGP